METKPVQTYVDTADKAVTDEPTLVFWIAITPTACATGGLLHIRDGFSTSDPIVATLSSGQGALFNFIPPIRCAHGLYIDVVSGLAYYTVGYLFERIALAKE